MPGKADMSDDAAMREFAGALKRLRLGVDADERDLALAGYRRVMQEIETVRAFLREPVPGGREPGGAR